MVSPVGKAMGIMAGDMKDHKPAAGHPLVAGVTKERAITLSDGVFSIAATLLVLELKLPEEGSAVPLAQGLVRVAPSFLAYALSFFVIALFWSSYHRVMAMISEVDRPIVTLNVVLLFLISLQPFPTALLGRYGRDFLAVALYAGVMALTGAALLLIWLRATRRTDLLRLDPREKSARALAFRLAVAPAVFALSIPLGWWHPSAAMASWVLILVLTLASRLRYG